MKEGPASPARFGCSSARPSGSSAGPPSEPASKPDLSSCRKQTEFSVSCWLYAGLFGDPFGHPLIQSRFLAIREAPAGCRRMPRPRWHQRAQAPPQGHRLGAGRARGPLGLILKRCLLFGSARRTALTPRLPLKSTRSPCHLDTKSEVSVLCAYGVLTSLRSGSEQHIAHSKALPRLSKAYRASKCSTPDADEVALGLSMGDSKPISAFD